MKQDLDELLFEALVENSEAPLADLFDEYEISKDDFRKLVAGNTRVFLEVLKGYLKETKLAITNDPRYDTRPQQYATQPNTYSNGAHTWTTNNTSPTTVTSTTIGGQVYGNVVMGGKTHSANITGKLDQIAFQDIDLSILARILQEETDV